MDNNEKKYSENQIIPIVVITIIVTALVSIVITAFLYYTYLNSKGAIAESFDSSASVEDKLNVIRTELEKYYLNSDEIEDSELVDSALKGYVAGLGDEYTELMTAKEYEELEQELSEYVGIGIYVGQSLDGEAVILAPVGDESPAFKAGIKAYDVIVKVNGEDVLGAGSSLVSSKVRGESGTEVKIEVKRNDETKEFTVKRENVQMYHVETKVLENNIGYMGMSTFNENCAQEFEQKYKELQEQNITGLVVDLRYNGGGLVDEVLDIVDLFVDKGKDVLITVDKNGKEEIEKAKGEKIVTVPVVVLVNEYSASASEIMAAALKEQANAKIVGKTTYGKGVIQVLHPLKDGSGIKVTVKEYLTPNRNTINKVGVTPDYEVDVTEEQMDEALEDSSKDLQLQKAIEVLK